jgi:DNA-binding transcriptional ArsR family regulator
MPRQRKNLSDAALQLIADRFKVLSEPMRLKILHALWDGEQTVGQIIASTHGLQANEQAGLVSRRKEGLNVYYRIVDEVVFDLCEAVCESLHDRLTEQIGELAPVPQRKRA